MTDQLANTNRAGMEHIELLVISVGSKELAIERARLGDTLIHINQTSAFIGIKGHGVREISFVIRKTCNEMSIDLGQIPNYSIGANPSRTI